MSDITEFMREAREKSKDAPSLQMAAHNLGLVLKSKGYKESNGDDWLGTPITDAIRSMNRIILSWQFMEDQNADLLEAVKWAYDAAKDHGYFNQVIEDRIAQAEGE
jgi:hypothetical protein